MAYQVVVSPLVGVVFDKLNSLIQNKFGESRRVQKEMKKLSKTLSSIENVLNDAEEKQVADKGIHEWLKELKDAAYKAEDVLEEWEFRDCQLAPEKVTDSLEELMESFDELAGDMVRFHLQRGISKKRPEISPDRETGHLPTEPIVYGRDEDRAELVKLLLDQCPPHRSRHPSGQRQLLDKVSSQEDTFICSIWGMGGLGKTTLAREVFKDSQVVGHFESKIWVCVSEDFDVARLIKLIIDFDSPNPCNLEALAPLQQRLQEKLSGKRFLLVLDDVWDDNQDKWNTLKGSLACGAKGSCIIITTRIKTVASIAGIHHRYELKVLSSEDCWLLFKQGAFGLENAERPSLVEIGKQIAAKCKGVPLAAKALGGLLRFENKESVWLAIRDSEIWELPENDIFPVLKLSYNHLSSPLKQCFAYCSIFPKDHIIDVKYLIHLWMANGFIQPKGKFDLEDAGDEIFRALLWRSLFQEIEEDGDGNMIRCKMHDLVQDLARCMATNECLALDIGNADAGSAGNITEGTRHLSLFRQQTSPFNAGYTQTSSQSLRSLISLENYLIVKEESASFFFALVRLRVLDLHGCQIQVVPECIGEMIHLRYLNLSYNSIKSLPEVKSFHLRYLNLSDNSIKSLPECIGEMVHLRYLNLSCNHYIESLPECIGEMIHLRYLNLSDNSIKSLPECIGEMIHLRYLNLSRNPIRSLPERICRLKNLQTMNVSWCHSLESLPKDTSQMINLRQIDIRGCWGLKSTPNDIGKLVCLHKLSFFIVGSENGCSIKELQELNHLGELVIKKLENVKNSVESEEASLKSKKNLHSLELSWSDGPDEVQENVTEVIEGLQPHSNLRRLEVEGYRGVTLPSWLTVSAVPNLVDIRLSGCRKCVRLPPLGRLPLLKVLRLNSMDSVRFIDDEVYGESGVKGFPSLEELSLLSMPNLEGWSSSVQAATTQKLLLPCLKILTLRECPKLNETVLGNVRDLPCLSNLHIEGLNDLVSFPEGALQNLTSLVLLVICSCKKLIALPVELQSLTTLEILWIQNCGELVSLGERNPSSLKYLQIENCPSLKRLPKLNKTCLERLDIEGCPELEFSTDDFEDLVVLEALILYGVPKMREGFPEWLKQYATMIRYLQIVGYRSKEEENEVDLPEWIGTLTSLEKLWIHGCRNRKVLPEGLRNLTALTSLRIFGCNEELERRCEEDKGEDWFKIAHVPHVEVTSKPWDLKEPSNCSVCYGINGEFVRVKIKVWL